MPVNPTNATAAGTDLANKFVGTTPEDISLIQSYLTDQGLNQYINYGGLWGFGINSSGSLGDNTTIDRSSPVQTVAVGAWKVVATGYAPSAGIQTDGTLWCWGQNNFGQLGTNDRVDRSSPIQTIAGGTNWKEVDQGNGHTIALKEDGTLWTWGYNANGQLGTGDTSPRSSPVQTVAGGTDWATIASSPYFHCAAIKTDGTLWAWGENTSGQIGTGVTGSFYNSPVQTISGGTNWKQVACGYRHTVAIKTDGTLWLWGLNADGQLGNNSTASTDSPVQTISGGTDWKLVACGFYHTLAIKQDGTLWTWGRNNIGQLGDGTSGPTASKSSPIQTISGGTDWKQVSGGQLHTAAVKTDGTLWVWGENANGRLGTNNTTDTSSPVQTVAGGTNWSSVSCAFGHTLAIART